MMCSVITSITSAWIISQEWGLVEMGFPTLKTMFYSNED